MSFGILTLAAKSDYFKAIGLVLSLRISNPGVPVAITCPKNIRSLVEPYFDYVIDEDASFKGFEHKVNLDRYSPFDETLFLDSDILVFRDVKPFIATWGQIPYTACGHYAVEGFSCFGLDVKKTLKLLGKDRFLKIEGVGHGLFRKPDCIGFFDRAREVTRNYRYYAGDVKYADEDAISIVMTMMDYGPAPWGEFFSRFLSARPGTMRMNAVKGECKFIHQDTGELYSPCTMHFAQNEAAFAYAWQLYKLFKQFNVPRKGLLRFALISFYKGAVKLRLHEYKKKLKKVLGIF
ncbi:MAG: hypothetical protein ACXW11_04460 [Methylotenera sp.]